jgi:thioesterase domain-containing protein
VRDAVAAVRNDADGTGRLVAWVVPTSPPPTVSALRVQLGQRLAPPLVPSRFVFLDALPLAASRKLDRGALPAPAPERPPLESAYAAPTNALESLLVHLWEELLELAPVGIRDAFLDLGGDSLAAVAMLERVEAALARPLSTALLASAATVEQLARALVAAQPPDLRAPLVALRPGGSKRPFVFLHGDYWSDGLYCVHASRHLDPERPLWLLPPCGLDGGPIPESIEAMAEVHLHALREAQPRGPYLLGGNCNGGLAALELARRLTSEGERVDALVVVRASARGVRYRFHAAAARAFVASLRRPRDEALLWRERLIAFAELLRRSDARARVRLVRDKLASASRALFPQPAAALAPSAACEAAPPTPGRVPRERLRDAFTRAAALYVPRPYGGRVTLLWPEADAEAPADAARSWARVARDVELRVLPGDHLSYATKHVHAFARELERCLARSEGAAAAAGC